MNYEKILSDFNGFHGQDFSQGLNLGQAAAVHGINPMPGFNNFATPYQFPAASSGINPFTVSTGAVNQGYGLKLANEPVYGPSAVETHQSHYGPPMHKGGKLKGAALSALTLLAFLFFLNLLQSCLKDQMEAMNPTVMVMSAGQRNILLNRNADDDQKLANENFQTGFEDDEIEYETDDGIGNGYSFPHQPFDDLEQTSTMTSTKKRKLKSQRRKTKTGKQEQLSLIESKLNNLALVRQGLIVKSNSEE